MKVYSEYQDSGVEWIGRIPSHWSSVRLKHVAQFYGGGTPDKSNEEYWNGNIPWVSPKDMKGDFVDDTQDHVSEEAVAGSSTRIVAPDSILVVVRSGILRHSIPVARNRVPVTLNQDMKAVVPNSRLLPDYFRYFIRGNQHNLLMEWRKQGATVESIEQENLSNTVLPLPPVYEQKVQIDYLNRKTGEIDILIRKKQALIDLLREQRAALINCAVTKGLDPDVPMKDSGTEWLGEVPEHWTIPKIKFVARVESGHTPSRKKSEYWLDCNIPWFTLSDVWQLRNGRTTHVYETSECVSELGLANSSARLLPKDTVILSRTASVGFSGILGRAMATSQDFVCWVCGPSLRPKYLLNVLRSMGEEFKRLLMGSTHKTIYMPDAYNFVTPLPPVEEQDEIVEYIERKTRVIDGVIDREVRTVELLKELRTSLISEVVTGKIDVRGEVPNLTQTVTEEVAA